MMMSMKQKLKNRKGQTMVEYILIVVLIAITLIALFGYFGKAVGKKVSGATSALDDDVGTEAQGEFGKLSDPTERIKSLDEDGSF